MLALTLFWVQAAGAADVSIDACECLLLPDDQASVRAGYNNDGSDPARLFVQLVLPNSKTFYLSPLGLFETPTSWLTVAAGASESDLEVIETALTPQSLPFGPWPLVPPYRFTMRAILMNAATGAILAPVSQTFFDFEPAPPSAPPTEPGVLHIFPHQHNDVAWLDREEVNLADAADWIANSMAEVQEDPSYRFVIDQPFVLREFAARYPALVADLQQMIDDGVVEVAGGFFIQPDLNLLSGESLARQVLYGQRYLEEAWGVRARTGWNLDSFGHPHQMPQIVRKGGMDFYAFTRGISDQPSVGLAGSEFYWESPDGSRVLANHLPFGYQLGRSIGDVAPDDQELTEVFRRLQPTSLTGNFPTGNGADVSEHVLNPLVPEAVQQWNAAQLPGVEALISLPSLFFEAIEQSGVELPTLADMEFQNDGEASDPRIFPGAYASRIEVKQTNQSLEHQLLDTEKLSTLAWIEGASYPEASLREQGERIAINQFHDYLPGSGVDAIYEDPDNEINDFGDRAEAVAQALGGHLADAVDSLVTQIDTQVPGESVVHAFVVFNTMAWERRDLVRITLDPASLPGPVKLLDADGAELPFQFTSPFARQKQIVFVADVPATGFATFSLVEGAPATSPDESFATLAESTTLDVGHFTAFVDAQGYLRAILSKSTGQPLLVEPDETASAENRGGMLWWADEKFGTSYDYGPALETGSQANVVPLGTAIIEGPVVDRIIVASRAGESSFAVREIVVVPDLDRMDFDTNLFWSEPNKNLYLRFPFVAREGAEITEGTPYGHRVRGAGHQPALRWTDWGDSGMGISLLNHGLFGQRFSLDPASIDALTTESQLLDVTLLRSMNRAVFGDVPSQSMKEFGRHTYRYSLVPHHGSWREARTPRRAWEFHSPLRGVLTDAHAGSLPTRRSYLALNPASDAVVSVLQRDAGDVVARLYETTGEPGEHELNFPFLDALTVDETNILGDFLGVLGNGRSATVLTAPEEIVTLRLVAPVPGAEPEPEVDTSFQQVIDLAGADAPRLRGIDDADLSGRAVTAIGDVDGDGYDDLLIGANQGDGPDNTGEDAAGEVYLVYGGPQSRFGDGFTLDQADVTFYGLRAGSFVGTRMTTGDFDADGFQDIVIGSPANPTGEESRNASGVTWVIFGGPRDTLGSSIDLVGGADLEIWGGPGDIGGNHAAVGDIDADGYDDLIIGAPSADGKDNAVTSAGEGYILFGGPRADFVKGGVRALEFSHDTVIWGAEAFDHSFWAVESGDLDADGYDDIVIGAIDADGSSAGKEAAGDVYVFWGGPRETLQDLEFFMSSLDNMSVFYGIDRGDLAGFNFGIDDVDGDGVDDLLIGAPFADGLNNAVGDITGEAYLIWGRPRAEWPAVNELADFTDVFIYGGFADESTGHTVFLSDLTGDGLAEVVVGAPVADGFQGQKAQSGTTHVLLGRARADWPAAIVLNNQNSNFLIRGAVPGAASGFALSAGDIDGNGVNDLVIGSPFYSEGADQRLGATYILFDDLLDPSPTDEVTILRAEWDPATGLLQVDATSSAGAGAFRQENEVFIHEGGVTTQLTANDRPETGLRVEGGLAVWQRQVGDDTEIFVFDGVSVTQLTDDAENDEAARTDGTNVVWMGFDGNDFEIYHWDGTTTTQVTDNALDDVLPDVSGGQVVWQGFDGSDLEIFLWDGTSTTQLTDNAVTDQDPRIDGPWVVWTGSDGVDFEIYLFDGVTTQQLSNNSASDGAPDVSGDRVAWIGFDGNDFEVFLWDGATVQQLSDNAVPDGTPRISAGRVVWSSGENEAAEIILWDTGVATPITSNSIADVDPAIDGNVVAWTTRSITEDDKPGDVFVWDGVAISQLTDDTVPDSGAQVSSGRVLWLANTVDATLLVPGLGNLDYDPETGFYSGSFAQPTPPVSVVVDSPLGGSQAVAVVTLPGVPAAIAAAVQQVTNNGDPRPDERPQVYGNLTVWQGFDGHDYEIFVFDGLQIVQLTQNESDDLNPRVHGNHVVWESWDESDVEIFLWDGQDVLQLTDNAVDDLAPNVHSGDVVWQQRQSGTFEVLFWSAGVTQTLTQNALNDVLPQVENGVVVWQGFDGTDFEIFRWDGGVPVALTNNSFDDLEPRIDGGDVVWRGFDGNDFEVFRHASGVTTQLTADDEHAASLAYRDGVAVWHQKDGDDPDIFRWEAGIVTQLTTNDEVDVLPQTHGGSVVWQGDTAKGFEIFLWDAVSGTTQLTDNVWADRDPQIHGSKVVWSANDRGSADLDVFLYDGVDSLNVSNNSEATPDTRPDVAAGIVAWQSFDGDPEISVSDGTQTLQLTFNEFEEITPHVDPVTGIVVWQALDDVRMRFDDPGAGEGGTGATIIGGDYEIFTWDGTAVQQLTDREKLDDAAPWIHAGQIVWVGGDSNDLEVFFFDGATTTQLTDNTFDENRPRIHGGRAVWQGWDGNDLEIFYFDGTSVVQLTDNATTDLEAEIDGDDVVWTGFDGSDFEIFHWNAVTQVTTQLTQNSFNDSGVQIWNGQTVWQGFDGSDFEIFHNDGVTTQQLTDNALLDERPRIAAGRVVWQTSDTFDLEVFYWDGSQVVRVTNNTGDDSGPEITDDAITWQGFDGLDFEVFLLPLP